jgi:hypothetical protein
VTPWTALSEGLSALRLGCTVRGAGPPVLCERGVPMFPRRATRPRRINNTGNMQEGRASESGGRDTNSNVDRAPPDDSPRVKPTLPRVGFLERPDLSKR